MARDKVQPADVYAAAQAVVEAGETPTIERVRSLLGRGSNSTIAPLLRQWKSGRSDVGSSDPLRLSGPEGQLEGFLGRVVSELRDEAQREVERVRAESERATQQLYEQLEALEQSRAAIQMDAERRLAVSEAAREAVEASYARMAARVEALEGSFAELTHQLREFPAAMDARTREHAEALGDRLTANFGERVARIHAEHDVATAERRDLRQRTEAVQLVLEPVSRELPRALRGVDLLAEQLHHAAARYDESEARAALLRERNQALRTEREVLEDSLRQCRKRAEESERQLARMRRQHRKELAELEARWSLKRRRWVLARQRRPSPSTS